MSEVILRILSIVGILLLILLGVVLFLLLLLLFWPVTYRVRGEKTPENLRVSARADWLFGVFRVRYSYPEPGNVVVKLLWKTLADSGRSKEAAGDRQNTGEKEAAGEQKEEDKAAGGTAEEGATDEKGSGGTEAAEAGESVTNAEDNGADESAPDDGEPAEEEPSRDKRKGFFAISEKIQKIKYTILKICDKIKEIWANISYYTDLLREENTALLWGHVKLRLGKILRNIRPRHIKADVLFGTGSPDTTGYAFGAYCMLRPVLGERVCVTPDFDRAILEGNADVAGHITLFTCVWNALKLLLDKKLQLFIKKMKAGRKGNGR